VGTADRLPEPAGSGVEVGPAGGRVFFRIGLSRTACGTTTAFRLAEASVFA
jgi:hypothetical protein